MSKSTSRFGLVLVVLAASLVLVASLDAQTRENVGAADVQQLRFPVHSNNVLFVDANGRIVYGIAGLHVTDFLGVPVVGGNLWEKSTNTFYAFAAVQTANHHKWVWLTNGGPAGVVVVRPDAGKVFWKDNQSPNRGGCVVPL